MVKKQTAYQKEVQRIKRQYKALEKRGYIIDTPIPKTLKGARNLTLDKIYKKSRFINQETGEVISGKRGRELERSRAAQKAVTTRKFRKAARSYAESKRNYEERETDYPYFDDIVIDNFIARLEEILNQEITWRYADKSHTTTRELKNDSYDTRLKEFQAYIIDEVNARTQTREDKMIFAKKLEKGWTEKSLDSQLDSMLHGYNNEEASYGMIKVLEVFNETITLNDLKMMGDMQEEMDYSQELL